MRDTDGRMKQLTRASKGQATTSGFALPTVLVASIVMMIVLLAALTGVSSISASMRAQYVDQIGRTAAKSGQAMATACLKKNSGTITWTNAKPLKPNTDCTGTETASCPTTSTNAACYVLKSNNVRTTFKVGVITSSDGTTATDIDVQGIVREVRKTSGEVVSQNNRSLKVQLQKASTSTTYPAAAPGSLATSNGVSCSIADGTLYCWGYSGYGQAGTGSSGYVTTPTAVAGVMAGKTVTKVSASFDGDPGNLMAHTCAIAGGSLYCWGYNGYYQLGNGSSSTLYSPVLVAGSLAGKTVTDVTTFNAGTCAIADGTLYCWGYSSQGQLGTGSSGYATTPTAVAGVMAGKTVTNVSSSFTNTPSSLYGHTCAIADGAAYCWGYNGYYQIGNGNTTTQYSPVLMAGGLAGKTVTDITTSNGVTCAIGSGTLYCWGYNGYGQLAQGSTTYVTTPTAVAGVMAGKTVTKVSSTLTSSAGNLTAHTCAIAGGSLYCWGYNGYYNIGNGDTTQQTSPVLIAGGLAGKTVTDTSTFPGGSCAIADGTLYCWGYSSQGQLGTGSSGYATTPTAVAGVMAGKTVTKVSSSFSTDPGNLYVHTCAIADASLYCWGYNGYYQVNGTGSSQYSPALISNGSVLPAGAFKDIDVGANHTCVVGSDGKAYCWGYNNAGQIGDGTTTARYNPVAVAQGAIPAGMTLKNISISGGGNHACALGSDGKAYCWGINTYGQLGDNSTTTRYSPVAVAQGAIPAGVTLKSISAGDMHVCAVGSDDKAYCWGNYYGLGNGSSGTSSSVPVAVSQGAIPSGVTVKSITAGSSMSCVAGSDNKAYCWGLDGSYGRLGNNTNTTSYVPVAVSQGGIPSGTTVTSLALGDNHVCATASDGKSYCWGRNESYQHGNNGTATSYVPTATSQGSVPAGAQLKTIDGGSTYNCAIGSDDKAYCWGAGSYNQQGNPSPQTYSPTPTTLIQGVMPSGTTVMTIRPGSYHTCLLSTGGKAYCLGVNSYGMLGNGNTSNQTAPVLVLQQLAWGVTGQQSIGTTIQGSYSLGSAY